MEIKEEIDLIVQKSAGKNLSELEKGYVAFNFLNEFDTVNQLLKTNNPHLEQYIPLAVADERIPKTLRAILFDYQYHKIELETALEKTTAIEKEATAYFESKGYRQELAKEHHKNDPEIRRQKIQVIKCGIEMTEKLLENARGENKKKLETNLAYFQKELEKCKK